MIDLNALRADVQMAQQQGRKMVTMHIDEAMSLLSRADTLETVKEFIPFKVGYVWPEDLHRLTRGDMHRIGLSRKKGPKYSWEVLVRSMPLIETHVDAIAESAQNPELQTSD